jgi:hypothetical protein
MIGALILPQAAAIAQPGPFSANAVVSLDIRPSNPLKGNNISVDVYVDITGVANSSSTPAALGAFIIPVSFDNTRLTLKAATTGTTSGSWSGLAYTDISRANARGFVTLISAQTGSGTPIGKIHVATLTFTADQAGKVLFAVNSARGYIEGSLASTYIPADGGPAQIMYNDQTTALEINPGSTTYHLIYPAFVSSEANFQGVAIVNESSKSANLTFRAYGVDGNLLSGMGMVNPNTPPALNSNAQYVKVVEEMFGLDNVLGSNDGWIDVESTSPNTSGFFLIGHTVNGVTQELDGADVSHLVTSHAIFPVLGKDTTRDTSITVVNPGTTPAAGNLKLMNSDGTTAQTSSVSIPAHGAFEQSYQSNVLLGDGYFEVELSSGSVTGLEEFGIAKEVAYLSAQDVAKVSNVLYVPHFANGLAGLRYFTELSVVNPGAQAVDAKFHMFDDNGAEIGSPVTQTIGPHAQLKTRVDKLFGLPDPATTSTYNNGVIKVECDGGLVGSVTFGDIDGALISSLPFLSTSSAKRDIYLDHVALGTVAPQTYWTGIAVVNASQERNSHVTIAVFNANGSLVGQINKTIAANARLIDVVSNLDSSFDVNQFGGFIHISSDVELFTFMLFGDAANTFISAVPVR